MEMEERNDVISYGVGFKVFRTLGPFLRGEGSYWLKRSNPRYDFGKHTVENMLKDSEIFVDLHSFLDSISGKEIVGVVIFSGNSKDVSQNIAATHRMVIRWLFIPIAENKTEHDYARQKIWLQKNYQCNVGFYSDRGDLEEEMERVAEFLGQKAIVLPADKKVTTMREAVDDFVRFNDQDFSGGFQYQIFNSLEDYQLYSQGDAGALVFWDKSPQQMSKIEEKAKDLEDGIVLLVFKSDVFDIEKKLYVVEKGTLNALYWTVDFEKGEEQPPAPSEMPDLIEIPAKGFGISTGKGSVFPYDESLFSENRDSITSFDETMNLLLKEYGNVISMNHIPVDFQYLFSPSTWDGKTIWEVDDLGGWIKDNVPSEDWFPVYRHKISSIDHYIKNAGNAHEKRFYEFIKILVKKAPDKINETELENYDVNMNNKWVRDNRTGMTFKFKTLAKKDEEVD